MNDEEMASTMENPENTECCHSTPQMQATEPEDDLLREKEQALSDDTNEKVLVDSLSYSDSDCLDSASQAEADQLEQLRSELNQLREALSAQNEKMLQLGNEYEEFFALYPNTPLSSLPDSVLDDVRRGIPLAAAFALHERRHRLAETNAEKYNLENQRRSSGAVTGTEPEYFSPVEVRAMSAAEVRENYSKIMQSMQKWN